MNTSQSISELVTALSKAQGSFKKVVFDKVNPYYKSKYASLVAVHDAIREPLAANGLAISHFMIYKDGRLVMQTTLFHNSGEFISFELPIFGIKTDEDKLTPQQLGSTLSYYRRYSICCLLAIPPGEEDDEAPTGEDDDAEEAERPKHANPVKLSSAELTSAIDIYKIETAPLKLSNEELISAEDAYKIEEEIADDPEYRTKLLNHWTKILGKPITRFDQIPASKKKPIWNSLNRRGKSEETEV
jgi:hypothetical protein